jgi:hypothetical protein
MSDEIGPGTSRITTLQPGKKMNTKKTRIAAVLSMLIFGIGMWPTTGHAEPKAQIAELYELQAAFHRIGTVKDPINGDSADVITQRIKDMMALWTADGVWDFEAGTPRDGMYIGKGDPDDAATCPTPSADPTNRGTLCTFFKYVSGSFQAANKFVSLAPSYLTSFTVKGKNATVSFQCHFFNVAIDPNTTLPLWTAVAHLGFQGTAKRIKGKWLFTHAEVPAVGVPVP